MRSGATRNCLPPSARFHTEDDGHDIKPREPHKWRRPKFNQVHVALMATQRERPEVTLLGPFDTGLSLLHGCTVPSEPRAAAPR